MLQSISGRLQSDPLIVDAFHESHGSCQDDPHAGANIMVVLNEVTEGTGAPTERRSAWIRSRRQWFFPGKRTLPVGRTILHREGAHCTAGRISARYGWCDCVLNASKAHAVTELMVALSGQREKLKAELERRRRAGPFGLVEVLNGVLRKSVFGN